MTDITGGLATMERRDHTTGAQTPRLYLLTDRQRDALLDMVEGCRGDGTVLSGVRDILRATVERGA